jgi:hypothetical protein
MANGKGSIFKFKLKMNAIAQQCPTLVPGELNPIFEALFQPTVQRKCSDGHRVHRDLKRFCNHFSSFNPIFMLCDSIFYSNLLS